MTVIKLKDLEKSNRYHIRTIIEKVNEEYNGLKEFIGWCSLSFLSILYILTTYFMLGYYEPLQNISQQQTISFVFASMFVFMVIIPILSLTLFKLIFKKGMFGDKLVIIKTKINKKDFKNKELIINNQKYSLSNKFWTINNNNLIKMNKNEIDNIFNKLTENETYYFLKNKNSNKILLDLTNIM